MVGRVMAFLHQYVGRWSLRGGRDKARQRHGDIDLLFHEAAVINEPFLDLMASLLAGVKAVDGEEMRFCSGSEEWIGEALALRGLALKRGPIKKPDRALQKLVRVYGRDVAMLTDLVRCTVVAEDLKQVEQLMSTVDARSLVGLAPLVEEEAQGLNSTPHTLHPTSSTLHPTPYILNPTPYTLNP
ncbi:hypothetical protein T484DRAFT_3099726 [Baffinella frigidus]|nr:hypothetical protein T484DRAFT_3099726 [Cryptophyta sp. CCMP2293]